ncbi:MAG TPA: hypothetical protein VFU21_19900 [Kofleriaceae bacterium]|nr:hypothetical protein [Kofleriaceae bacterium]
MKTIAICLSLALLPTFNGGCADEGDIEECIGLNCPNGFQWPYGGELRLWYIHLPDNTELQRMIGFFIESQTPDILPDIEIGYCSQNREADPGIGYGSNIQYIDVGPSLTMDLNDFEVEIPKVEGPLIDFADRPHESAIYQREISTPTGPGFFNAMHKVTLAADTDFEQVLDPGIYMPPAIEVIQPTGVPITFHGGRDLTIEWRNVEEPSPDYATVGAIVFIPDAGPSYQCLVLNNGRMVVPGDFLNLFEADTGVMVIGTAANAGVLRPDGRWQSMFGMNCHLTPFQRLPPPE